jgi:hypothetical protein
MNEIRNTQANTSIAVYPDTFLEEPVFERYIPIISDIADIANGLLLQEP